MTVRIHRALLTLLLCLPLVACLQVPSRIEGVLHGEQVWSGVVQIAGDVILAPDSRVTVRPGTEIVFLPPDVLRGSLVEHPHFPGSELIVQGVFLAQGTPEAPIVFRAADPQGTAGSWGAVNIEGSPNAIFEYCLFRQADSAVHSREARVHIEQCLFEDNLVGIRFHSSEILIENNLLRNNDVGIRFHFGAPVICNNRFTGNRVNLFVTSDPREYRIENNSFGAPAEYQVVLGENVPEDVTMTRNYWDVPDLAALLQRLYDGRRSDYLGRVLVDPVLPNPPKQAGTAWIR